MSAETIQVRADLIAKDEASPAIRAATETLAAFERQVRSLGAVLGKGLGAELARSFESITSSAKALGGTMTEAGEKGTRAFTTETAAARELSAALRDVASAQEAVARGAGRGAGRRSSSTRTTSPSPRNASQRAPQPERDAFSAWRVRQRIKANSERIERRDAERERVATASAAAAQVRAQHDAFAQRLRDARYLMGVRERSEAAELRHLAGVRREHDAMRRRAASAGRHAYGHMRHAVNSVNHPVLQSSGFWLHAGAVFGIEAGKHMLDAARGIDAATTRYRMMPGVSTADAAAVRANALREGLRIGLDPAEVVRLQLQGMKDGLSEDIAASLPAVVNAAVQTMGGSVDRDGDELAKAVREAFTVGWVRDAAGARSLMNSVAGLSTFNGNSPEKMQQFLASGGIGRGKELGWSKDQTLAFGAALNGSGERTGLGSARLMAQIPEIRARMFDRYVKATRSHDNSEENRITRAAPRMMGYGSAREMQHAFATPEGVTDFLSRLGKLPEQARAAIEKGYGLGTQFNAVAAEMGADHGARYRDAFKREQQLSSQNAGNDDLSKNSKIWSGSIDFMVGQLKASVEAIQSELGDVIKYDILTPFTKWWLEISESLLNSGMKADFHRAIIGFVEGLGFSDVTAALNSLRSSVETFNFAGFARGVGEGLRAFVDQLRSLASVFGGAGGLDAQTVGRLAAELFGLSIALHVVAPIVTTIGGIASAFLALKSALVGGAWVARLTDITEALGAGGAVAGGAAGAGALGTIAAALTGEGAIALAIGALPITIATVLAGTVLAVTIANWPAIKSYITGDGNSNNAAADLGPNAQVKNWRLKSVPEALRNDPSQWSKYLSRRDLDAMQFGPNLPEPSMIDRFKGLFHRSAYEGGEDPNNWRNLMTPAAYVTGLDDASAGDRDRDTAAMVGTSRAAQRIADSLATLVPKLGMSGATSTLSTVAGFGGGGGEGGGNANLRYGRGVAGGYRSTPGTGSYGNPSKSLLDLIAQSEGTGYNMSWGNGKFLPGGKEQNLTGKTLNEILALGDTMRRQPGARNSSAMGRYQITGETIRDLMKRMHLTGSEKFDEKTQDAMASKLIADDGPRALNRWEGLKRGTYMARARALLQSGSIAPQPGDVSSNGAGGGNAGKAVDLAMQMQGAGERSAQQILGAYMHPGEWCADFVNGALKRAGVTGSGSAMARSFSAWGRHVDPGAVQKGDVITERHGNHVGHVGLATGNVQRDRAGNVVAVEMISGNYGHQVRKNWERRGLIDDIRRANPTPGDLAGAARALPKGSSPAPHHAPAPHAPMQSAQAAPMTVHITNHINGNQDPHHLVKLIGEHFENRQRSRYTDVKV